MGLKPCYRLLANSNDITDVIGDRFMSLSLTDEAGMESDQLRIVLSDADDDDPIQLPPAGAELELFLGYDDDAQRMGLFVVDDIDLLGQPASLEITAHAAPFEQSKGGKTQLQTQKSRSWAKGVTIGAIVKKIAAEHSMQAAVAPSLASITLPHLDQSDESDMHFLLRIAKRYDAVVKPAGGKIVMAKRGESKTASGKPLPAITLKRTEVSPDWRVGLTRRDAAGSVVATWHSKRKAKRQTVTVGQGEPVRRLRQGYSTREMARAAAQAEMDRQARGEATLSLTAPGRPDIAAEAPLTIEGWRAGVPTSWIIKSVEHTLDNQGGYTVAIDAELPNGGAKAAVVEGED